MLVAVVTLLVFSSGGAGLDHGHVAKDVTNGPTIHPGPQTDVNPPNRDHGRRSFLSTNSIAVAIFSSTSDSLGTNVSAVLDDSGVFEVTTDPVAGVNASAASLNGNLTGLGGASSADVQFKYWVKGDEATTSQWTNFETLTSAGEFDATVGGLRPGTTYVVRAQARDANGTWVAGATVEFTTAEPFGVETVGASNVTGTTAALVGNLTGLGGATFAETEFTVWESGRREATQQWTFDERRSSPGQFEDTVSGLDPATTYVVRAQAESSTGTWTAGSRREFVTEPLYAVDTGTPSDLTVSSATLEGDLVGLGNDSSVDVQFKFWVQGDPANASFTPFRARTDTGHFTESVGGLASNTTYVVRAQARNDSGVYTTGGTVEFTTAAAPFGVTTDRATDLTDRNATFVGNLSGLGASSQVKVQFKYWVAGEHGSTTRFVPLRTKRAPGQFSETVTDLSPNTTYAFRAQGRDSSGTWTAGSNSTVTTTPLFAVTTGSADNVTRSGATLHGTVDGLGDASSVDVQFRYWVQGQQSTTAQFTSFQTLTSAGPFAATVSLQPDTTYVFRARMRDDDGERASGANTLFETTTAHDVDSGSTANVTATTATFRTNVTSLGGASSIDVQFKYWVQGDAANTSRWTPFGTVSSTGQFAETVTDLAPNTTYVVRPQAVNASGEYVAADEFIVETPQPYVVETDQPTEVGPSSMTLNGELVGLSGVPSAAVQFKYWVKGEEATTSQWTSFETLTSPGPFSADVSGLSANTTYVVRAQARNADGEWTSGTTVEVTTGS